MTNVRAQERSRLVRLAIFFGSGERIVGAFAGAARVSLLVWALGARDYGLYVLVLGVVATANLLDFGVHYGVLTSISLASGRDDTPEIRRIASTGMGIYSALSGAALLVL